MGAKIKSIKKQNFDQDYIKANRKAERDIRKDYMGDGFKSSDKPHKSMKAYSRKGKNKFSIIDSDY